LLFSAGAAAFPFASIAAGALAAGLASGLAGAGALLAGLAEEHEFSLFPQVILIAE
jgi:hypothetical protein